MTRRPFGWRKVFDRTKLEEVKTALTATVEEEIEDLLIFDARQMDIESARQLLDIIPELVRMRRAWRAHFAEFGCLVCHAKKTEYGAGGLCFRCNCRIGGRMRRFFRNIGADRDVELEIAALTEHSDVARWLLADGKQPRVVCGSKGSGPLLTYKTKRDEEDE